MFGFNFFDRKTLYIIIGLLALLSLASYGIEGIFDLILSVPAVLIAITVHECGHAIAAYKLGDDTAYRQGRISLNPLDHIDPLGLAMLLFAHIGWGKPVQVDPRNYNRNISVEKADAIVSIAGPAINLILAFIFTLIYFAIYKFAGTIIYTSTIGYIVMQMIMYIITINIGLGIFNLIPLPPLDGSKVIKPFLSYNLKTWFENREGIFYVIFIALWITGIAGIIISPIIEFIFDQLITLGAFIFRV